MLHVDTKARDSLACDLMEPVRPKVDAFLLDWIMNEPLKRGWLFEQPDGNCRLRTEFTAQLSETAPMWGRAVAPFGEWVTRALWSSSARLARESAPPTRLTQRTKREIKGAPSQPPSIKTPRRDNLCRGCGKTIQDGRENCATCAVGDATKNMLDAARIGRRTANGPKAQEKRASTQRKNALAQRHSMLGSRRTSRHGSLTRFIPKRSNRFSPPCQHLPSRDKSQFRAGMLGAFERATVHIHDTGWRWRN